jgi:hypothetical protein
MSTDPLAAALGLVDAAVRNDASPQDAVSRDLMDLAAAIDRVGILIAAGSAQGTAGSAAVERIADIAFTLHERDVEPSLCDALDAAVREISDVGAIKQASVERTSQATALLRELSRRVNDMIAQSDTDHGADLGAVPPAADETVTASQAAEPEPSLAHNGAGEEPSADDVSAPAVLSEADTLNDQDLIHEPTAPAASLPSPADVAEPASDSLPEPADTIAQPFDQAELAAEAADDGAMAENQGEMPHAENAAEVKLIIESSRGAFLGEPSLPQTPTNAASSSEQFSGDGSSGNEVPLQRDAGDESPREEDLSGASLPESSANEPSEDAPSRELASDSVSREQSRREDTPNETTLASSDPSLAVPSPAVDDQPRPVTQTSDESDSALASPAPPSAGDDHPEPGSPTGTADSVAQGGAASTGFAGRPTVPYESEDDSDAQLFADTERQRVPSAVDRARPDEHAVGARFATESSRALLPESQPAVGPEEDPGDLFEPVAGPPFASPFGAMIPAGAQAQPGRLASDSEPARAPFGETGPQSGQHAKAAMPGSDAERPSAPSEFDAAGFARSPATAPNAKPPTQTPLPPTRVAPAVPAQAVAPRQAANDPLAPVRALSEEEMIALFS